MNITIWIEDELAERINDLARKAGKTTVGERDALIWWLLKLGVSEEEKWRKTLEEVVRDK